MSNFNNPASNGKTATRCRVAFIFLLTVFGIILPALVGEWLDSQETVNPRTLHTVFLALSILVTTVVALVFLATARTTSQRLLGVVAAIFAWRISFFPILVLAGCLASWINVMTTRFFAYDIVYPILSVSFALLFAATIYFATNIIKRKRLLMTFAVVVAGTLAGVVSFIAPSDIKWALAPTMTIPLQPVPLATPVANPYPWILRNAELNWRQRLLMHIGSITYQSLPNAAAPWAVSVKGSLENLIRHSARYQSDTFLNDHYRAFSAAHPTIRHP